MDMEELLSKMVDYNASDLYLNVDSPATLRVDDSLQPLRDARLSAEEITHIVKTFTSPEQWKSFQDNPELNLAIHRPGIGRFRVNVFKQKDNLAIVIRRINNCIPDMKSLGIPDIISKLVAQRRGLILFVGATGTGKSTSLAAMVNHLNQKTAKHIVCIEDPIEYIHEPKKCIISQREIGIDTHSYEKALENTLRQAPDVIMVGEIRNQKTMEYVINFSETGHLCFSTLHANNANQAIERIVNFFPKDRHQQIYMDLSFNLISIVSQRLVLDKNGNRTATFEILTATPYVKDLISKGKVDMLKEAMQKSNNAGMQTFDQDLLRLYDNGTIYLEEALKHADSATNMKLEVSLKEGRDVSRDKAHITRESDPNDLNLTQHDNNQRFN